MAALHTLTRFLLWFAIVIGIILGLARVTFLRWVRLPTNDPVLETSILPTLEGGDLILLSRIGTPVLGDLILCPEPQFPERYVIGRILGEAGDRVQFKNGRPHVNGKPLSLERSCDPSQFSFPHPGNSQEQVTQSCHWEDLAGNLHMMGDLGGHQVVPEDRLFEVPPGKWFLVSDNRLFPYDSRDFGYIDVDSCSETVVGRIVSRRGWGDVARRLNYIQ